MSCGKELTSIDKHEGVCNNCIANAYHTYEEDTSKYYCERAKTVGKKICQQ